IVSTGAGSMGAGAGAGTTSSTGTTSSAVSVSPQAIAKTDAAATTRNECFILTSDEGPQFGAVGALCPVDSTSFDVSRYVLRGLQGADNASSFLAPSSGTVTRSHQFHSSNR